MIPGEVAVITDGGAGIGRRIACTWRARASRSLINDFNETALAAAKSTLADKAGAAHQGDASNPSVASDLVKAAIKTYDGLDILMDNVAIAGPTAPVEDVIYDKFIGTLEVNLGAMFATTKAALSYLRERTDNRIMNISLMSGKRPLRDRAPYDV